MTSYRDKELLALLDIPGGDHTEDVTEPGVVALHVEDVPLLAVVDQMPGGGLVVVPVLVRDVSRLKLGRFFPAHKEPAEGKKYPS